MSTQAWFKIVWPAFLAAAVMEMLVFAFIDPGDLYWADTLQWSRQAVYTLAFFGFWAVTLLGSFMTWLLGRAPGELNPGAGAA